MLLGSFGISQNLVVNGEFNSGLDSWSTFVADFAGVSATITAANNEANITNINGAGGQIWHVQLNQLLTAGQIASLSVGESYNISFSARSDAANRQLRLFFGQDGGAFTALTVQDYQLTTSMTTYETTFTLTEIFGAMKVGFEMGLSNNDVFIDNVVLELAPPTCDDGIQNGDETGVDCGGPVCAPCATAPDPIYDLLESFNGTGLEGTFGGAIAVYDADPAGGSDQVIKITNVSTPNNWQGIDVVLPTFYKLTAATQLTMQLDVYSTTAITIAPKAQGGELGSPDSVTFVSHTGSGWETLTFTFDKSLDGKVPANGIYGDFALHINWNATTNSFGAPDGRIFYIKNLKGLATQPTPDPNAPVTAAPTPPARPAADVISIFSDAYDDIAVDTYDTSWCPATTTEVMIEGNPTKKVTGLGCEGIDWQSARTVDASSFTFFHMDIYTASETFDKSFNMKFSNWAGGNGEFNAIEFSATNANLLPSENPGTWISFDIPINNFTIAGGGSASISDIVQFIISSNLGTVYYDNLYLHKNTVLSTDEFSLNNITVSPNPARDSWNVQTNQTITNVQVFDILGKEVINFTPNSLEFAINANNLNNGLYLAKLSSENGSQTVKLIKN